MSHRALSRWPQAGLWLPAHRIQLMDLGSAGAVGVLTFCTKDKCPQKCLSETSEYMRIISASSPHSPPSCTLSLKLNQEKPEFPNMQNMVPAARYPPRLGSNCHLLHGAVPNSSSWNYSPPSGAHSSTIITRFCYLLASVSPRSLPPLE